MMYYFGNEAIELLDQSADFSTETVDPEHRAEMVGKASHAGAKEYARDRAGPLCPRALPLADP